jgi:hypothetical protein
VTGPSELPTELELWAQVVTAVHADADRHGTPAKVMEDVVLPLLDLAVCWRDRAVERRKQFSDLVQRTGLARDLLNRVATPAEVEQSLELSVTRDHCDSIFNTKDGLVPCAGAPGHSRPCMPPPEKQ